MTHQVPNLVTELPGPRAKSILTRDEKVISPSYTRAYPLVVKNGRGAVVEDVDGNKFLDLTAGIATCSTGHCHPDIVAAIQRQAAELIHMSGTDFYYENMVTLADKLCRITPGNFPKRVYFGNSGTEAMEAALKLARYHTRRQKFVAFLNGFHGRTMGALSLTASKAVQRHGFEPLLPGVLHIPYAYCYRCAYNLEYPSCSVYCVDQILPNLFKTIASPDDVAAIVVETIQGEGGYVVPPKEFFTALRRIADAHGILLIADEVQSGMGRTGKFWACEHFDFMPDMIVTAKGIASGLPLGVVIARAEVMDWEPGSHASTFGGNPVACAAALETIRLIEERYLENCQRVGAHFLEKLRAFKTKYCFIGDVRGIGLMLGIEIIKDRENKTKDKTRRDCIVQEAFQRGLLLLGCGENSLRFSPPLVITKEEINVAVRILDEVFAKLA